MLCLIPSRLQMMRQDVSEKNNKLHLNNLEPWKSVKLRGQSKLPDPLLPISKIPLPSCYVSLTFPQSSCPIIASPLSHHLHHPHPTMMSSSMIPFLCCQKWERKQLLKKQFVFLVFALVFVMLDSHVYCSILLLFCYYVLLITLIKCTQNTIASNKCFLLCIISDYLFIG